MISEQWEQVKDYFEAALELIPSERDQFLSRLAKENPSLGEQVTALVNSYEAAGSFLNESWTLLPDLFDELDAEMLRFHPDDVICGRFRIVRLIGKGGMGEVYEAWDQERESRIALKTLRFEISAHELYTARFRREIQLALKVTHSNVCRIFDTFRHLLPDGSSVAILTMELLEGHTLAEYLKKHGRLSTQEAWPLVVQIIKGLSAVHAAGVIHRDLKPSNLILVPDGQSFTVKLTDFGIAGNLPADESFAASTHASKLLGTPDYMAPEQLELGQSSIQSDIYSLGLILYEAITGTKPFGNLAWKRLHDDPPPISRYAQGLPQRWERAIQCCLDRNPKYRFTDASAIVGYLSGQPSKSRLPAKPLVNRFREVLTSRVGVIVISICFLVALFIITFRYLRKRIEIPRGTTILLTQFKNETGEPEFSALIQALKSQLAQSAHFEIEEDRKVAEVLKQMHRNPNDALDMSTAREVAWRSGSPLVISVDLRHKDQSYVLSVSMQLVRYSPLFPARTWKQEFVASTKVELLQGMHDAAHWIRASAGESAEELATQDRPVEDTTTASWTALQIFTQAEKRSADGDKEGALLLFREAIQADPQFATAYMRLADTLIYLKHYSEGYQAWHTAIQLSDQHALTSRENLRIKAHYFDDTGDYVAAERNYREYTLLFPNDYLGWFYWGSILDTMNRKDDAIFAFQRSASLNPASFAPHAHLAMVYLALHKHAQALNEIQEVGKLGEIEWSIWLLAHAEFLENNFDKAFEQIENLKISAHTRWHEKSRGTEAYWQSQAISLEVTFLAETGKNEDAVNILDGPNGIAFDRAHGLSEEITKLLGLAYLSYKAGKLGDCERNALQAAISDESPKTLTAAGTLLERCWQDVEEWMKLAPFSKGWIEIPKCVLRR